MTHHERRTVLRALGLGATGVVASTYATGGVAATPTITVEGGGYDIWNDRDEFHYYYTEVDGDFDVSVRVDSLTDTDNWARAGLMVRQTLADDAEHAMIRKTPGNETSVQWRSDDGEDAQSTTSGGTGESEGSGGAMAADWQRLVRDGDTIEAYGSTNGENWTLIADLSPGEVDFAGSAFVGLAVCSHSEGTLTTAEFSNLAGLSPDSNRDIGDVDVAGSISTDGGSGGGDAGVAVSTGSASNVGATTATVGGSLDDLGGAASADVALEYRQSGSESWTTASTATRSSTGSVTATLSGLAAATDYEFRVVATASDGDSDAGSVNAFTTATASASGPVTVEGAGVDIWNESDEGHYYYADVSGDFDAVVRVDGVGDTDDWAKAGLHFRESLSPDAKNAMVRRTPGNDSSFQWRPETDASTVSTTSGGEGAARNGGTMQAAWQRLVRAGDTLRAYLSTDGDEWTLVGELSSVDFADDGYLGLAVTSHSAGTLCTGEFSELSGVSPDSNRDIGGVDVAGSVAGGETNPDTDPTLSTGTASNVGTAAATLSGSLDDLGGAASADVAFEYRESGASDWTATAAQTVSETGAVSTEVSGLSSATDYEFRATATASDGDTAVGGTASFTTEDDSGGTVGGGAHVDYEDGFADVSWFGDGAQVVTVERLTYDEVQAAFETSGPRVVVFEESGVLDLQNRTLEITEPNCWVAAQTAPSPGVTFTNGFLQVDADDCIVQHVRVFRGDESGGEGTDPMNSADGTSNVIFDHCSAFWGRDENLSVGYDSTDMTLSNCLVAEGLEDPEENSNGTLIGDNADNVAIMGTVYAKNNDRNPRHKDGSRAALANNLVYYFDKASWLTGGAEASVVGCRFVGRFDWSDAVVKGEGSAYFADNSVVDPGLEGRAFQSVSTELSSRPLWPSGFDALPSGEVESQALAYAGARPADRIDHERRVVSEIETRALDTDVSDAADSAIPNSVSAVGGYPSHGGSSRSLSPPESGLKEWLDRWALAVEEPDASPP